ncbi:DoxX family protein [Amaricoccus solimangrovi]|uniref:DoxX family protein n=1 Tax=Amaricoccus solimangrovi TaxID=2589815 RepID=A0A501WL57_9RHOB|nr:DoxX family protein [Amaricoccus solimangrovi]TPE49135.1 DoxX family protein [Amaricoccus solimangrovi]
MTTRTETFSASLPLAGADYAAAAGRLLIAAIFLLSGFSKVTGLAGTVDYIAAVGLPAPTLAALGAIAVELLGGIALVAGLRTRLVASVLAVFTLATAVFFHADLADQNQFIHFFKNIAIAGGLLQVIAFGAGRLSLDRG